jgi:hypothetical protein
MSFVKKLFDNPFILCFFCFTAVFIVIPPLTWLISKLFSFISELYLSYLFIFFG